MNESISIPEITGESPRFGIPRPQIQPQITSRDWKIHGGLFLLTIVTTILAGTMLVMPEINVAEPTLKTPLDYVLYVPLEYLRSVEALLLGIVHHPSILFEGIAFSTSLLSILFAHEMGHYLTCRQYGVDATLPFFIPAPPLFLAGTFGAFIKIRSAIPSRRALFDIGLAGPLAGFVIALPISVIGLLIINPEPVHAGAGIVFNDPLLFRMLAKVLRVPLEPTSTINPYYMAAWIGLLVTSLNLMPVGQLDGGHGTFAVFGPRVHRIVGRIAFVTVVVLSVLGFLWHGSPSGFLYAVLLGIMLRVRHPEPATMEPLGMKRTVIAILTLLVFLLCFVPFPIALT